MATGGCCEEREQERGLGAKKNPQQSCLHRLVTDRMVTQTEKCLGILTWQECEQTCSLHCCFRIRPSPSWPVTLAEVLLSSASRCINGEQCQPSRKPLSPVSKKGGRTSPSPGQVLRQESPAPALPLNPAGFPRVPPVAPAHLFLSLSL